MRQAFSFAYVNGANDVSKGIATLVGSGVTDYHIRDAELSFGMLVLCGFISLWHMPLFFLLAGWSAVVSRQTRALAPPGTT